MDGIEIAVIVGGFIPTWITIGKIYYKLGRIEQKLDNLNSLYVSKEDRR